MKRIGACDVSNRDPATPIPLPAAFVGTEREPTAAAFQLALYPNPASRIVTITLEGAGVPAALRVHDVTGREVAHGSCSVTSCVVGVEQLPIGVYNVSLSLRSGTTLLRSFVVTR